MGQPVYESQRPFEDRGSDVLVVACSAYAFLPYVREFLEAHLEMPDGSYNLLAVPGGPRFMALSEYLPKFAWVGNKWVSFAVEKLQVRRIVLVAHEDCAWYADQRFVPALLHALGHADTPIAEHQRADLRSAVAALRASAPGVAVEAYFAGKAADGKLAFTREG